METNGYSHARFFNTLRDTVVAQPYAVIYVEEVNSILNKIDTLDKDANSQCLDYALDFRRAVENARNEGYFPVVILASEKYETALSIFR